MKQLFILALILIYIKADAQFYKNNAIYETDEVTVGNYLGAWVQANYILKEKYSFKIGYSELIRKAMAKPEDYSPGIIGLMALGLLNPFDRMENFQVFFGKIVPLNEKRTIRANISLGLGYTLIREPTNWQPLYLGILDRNYSFDYGGSNSVSLIINPKTEFPITKHYGFTISPIVQLNKYRNYYGIGIGKMLGILKKTTDYSN